MLPRGFVKIRHYGLLANRGRSERLALCRALLAVCLVIQHLVGLTWSVAPHQNSPPAGCPACGSDEWRVVAELPRPPADPASQAAPAAPDTS